MTGPMAATIAALIGLYALHLFIWPLEKCPRCKGDGKLFSPITGKAFRLCPKCDGSGKRLKFIYRAHRAITRKS